MYRAKKNIIESKIREYMIVNDITNLDKSFLYYVYSIYNGLEYDDINPVDIVDGSQDKQIDAIYTDVDENNEKALIRIFQMKKTGGFSSDIVIKMKNGLEWIFERPLEELEQNKNVNFVSKAKEISEIMGKIPVGDIDLEIYFITLGNINDIQEDDEYYQELKLLKSRYSTLEFNNFDFFTIIATKIYNQINLI